MSVTAPPRLSDVDIDYIVDRPPVWIDNPDFQGAPHLSEYIASIKDDTEPELLQWFEDEGYNDASWNWLYLKRLPQDADLDEYGPLSLP